MNFKIISLAFMTSSIFISNSFAQTATNTNENDKSFNFVVDRFADIKILRYQVPGFENLTLQQKTFLYYLSKAAVAGRDIMFDQNGKYNLAIRRTLETINDTYKGDRTTADFAAFTVYLKRVWFSNGIYHHYASDKFLPEFSQTYFNQLIDNLNVSKLPLSQGETKEQFIAKITPVIFDPSILSKKVSQDSSKDLVQSSAVNFYEGVSQKEVEAFYNAMKKPDDKESLSFGLNSKLVKENGKLVEKTYKIDGMYGEAIVEIVKWLEKAVKYTENDIQRQSVLKLIAYYKTGDLKTWDEYNILWVKDLSSLTDFVNGFIEVYDDPLGIKASWESVVNFKNMEATHRAEIISANAQWFEDHSTTDPRFKKKEVKGVTAKVITVAQLGGACYPATPIGINLPNAEWIREKHGSKSVTIDNIMYAYDKAAKGTGFNEEFTSSKEEIEIIEKYGFVSDNLHVDLHECVGHGSGQLLPNVSRDALKSYSSTLEETRADLFALYYGLDPKMVELGLLPNADAAKAEYIKYIRNGLLTQITRVQLGKDVEESHMRNRQLISKWCFEKGKANNVIEQKKIDGKTYFVINDFQKLRTLVGELLREVQRIKSEGDYEAGKLLVENYAVKIDYELHKEVLERYKKLNLAPYNGFINPEYVAVEKDGKITDVKIVYPTDYSSQMIKYSKECSFLK